MLHLRKRKMSNYLKIIKEFKFRRIITLRKICHHYLHKLFDNIYKENIILNE